MSEFQYFDFRAVERPLSKQEQSALRSFSTRAEIGARRFVNEYHWGSFKGDTIDWMKRYFDGHVYLSKFGSRALHLRIPRALLDRECVRPYEIENVLEVRETAEHLILSLFSDEEESRDYDEIDEDPSAVLDDLLPLRDELIRGDLRALYIVWLLAARNNVVGYDTPEPPVPDGLGELSDALMKLTAFLWLEPELVEVAARNSAPQGKPLASDFTPKAWLGTLSAREKEMWLERILTDEEGHAPHLLQREFHHAALATRKASSGSGASLRTSRDLLVATEHLMTRRREEAARKAAEERAAREKREAEQRRAYLLGLNGTEAAIWKSIIALTATTTPANYDTAVRQLRDVRDLAAMTGQEDAFAEKLAGFRELRRRKSSLIERLDQAGLA